jgi:hypothetical protein
MRKSSDSVTAGQKGRFELQNLGNSPENGSGAGWEASANFCFWPLQCYRLLSPPKEVLCLPRTLAVRHSP